MQIAGLVLAGLLILGMFYFMFIIDNHKHTNNSR